MDKARMAAAKALIKVEQKGGYSNLSLDSLLSQSGLPRRDRAFAAALFYGVLERLLTLDGVIGAYSKTPLEKLTVQVRVALQMGLYQMLYMDSVPDSAAVNESVNLIKALGLSKASGFVNGVLRSVLRAEKKLPSPRRGERPAGTSVPALFLSPMAGRAVAEKLRPLPVQGDFGSFSGPPASLYPGQYS